MEAEQRKLEEQEKEEVAVKRATTYKKMAKGLGNLFHNALKGKKTQKITESLASVSKESGQGEKSGSSVKKKKQSSKSRESKAEAVMNSDLDNDP